MQKINYSKLLAVFTSTIVMVAIFSPSVFAFEYTLLDASILGKESGTKISSWTEYLKLGIKAFYTFLASAAIFVITVYGVKYMLSELPNVKNDAKGRIADALIGLVLALSAYLILEIINPTLLTDTFTDSIKLNSTTQ